MSWLKNNWYLWPVTCSLYVKVESYCDLSCLFFQLFAVYGELLVSCHYPPASHPDLLELLLSPMLSTLPVYSKLHLSLPFLPLFLNVDPVWRAVAVTYAPHQNFWQLFENKKFYTGGNFGPPVKINPQSIHQYVFTVMMAIDRYI